MKKCLLIICDGMGDRPVGGKTPLDAAKTPNMDALARKGICGIMDTVRPGIRPGSDTAHLSLFGFDPFEVYTGRGPFEAAGAGLSLEDGDVAFRCNFATVEDGLVIDRRAGRGEFGLDELATAVSKIKLSGSEILFGKGAGHRCVLVLRSKGLSACIRDTDPEDTNTHPVRSCATDSSSASERTASLLNEFTEKAHALLKDHPINQERVKKGLLPANIVLCRGCGMKPEIDSFPEKYGLSAACVSATTLIKGVCRTLGMDVIDVPEATGHFDSDIKAKAEAAVRALESHDFVFLHLKGTDEVSHDGSFDLKKEMIERIDSEVISYLSENLKDVTLALTADHSTPVSLKEHSADPVPLVIAGDVRTDDVSTYTERDCAKGGLLRVCGKDLLNIMLDIANHAKLFGA